LGVFENRVVRRKFGFKKEEVKDKPGNVAQ
jgi:hypothetical protein